MKRDTVEIKNTVFDLLVIGGGIHGAAICYKAAQSGLRVLLAEKQDFAAATSANSLKILHGGLRYLQTLDFKRMRDSVSSRREMMRMAPHLVTPLPCAMPAYGHGLKGREIMRLAMLVNDIVSMDRNRGLVVDNRLPTGHTLNKKQCLDWMPGISTEGLHGASVWYDALALNTERMVMDYLLKATEFGAACINYLSVESLSRAKKQNILASVRDHADKESFTVQAKYVINCAGAAFEELIPGSDTRAKPVRWARALNIVVRKNLFPQGAVALEKKYKHRTRMLFMVPWREHYTMIGTHYIVQERAATELFPVDKPDILAMIDEINMLYPSAGLSFQDVSFYHAGLLPVDPAATIRHRDQPDLQKESLIIDHGQHQGLQNVYSINSIKYTTAPSAAEKVLRQIKLASSERTGPNKCDKSSFVEAISPETELDHYLCNKYGTHWIKVKPYVEIRSTWLDPGKSLLQGEIDYFMHEELALHLDDIVFRRSDLGSAECPSMKTLKSIAEIMANEYSWDAQQKEAELEKVLQRYAPLNISASVTE